MGFEGGMLFARDRRDGFHAGFETFSRVDVPGNQPRGLTTLWPGPQHSRDDACQHGR